MTNSELLEELGVFQKELEEHRRLWGGSLDDTLPDLPQTNVETLQRQCRSLARRLGVIQPYLRALRPSWAMSASGVTWDALEEAVRSEQTAAIKGPSLDAVIQALEQVVGRLQREPPGAEALLGEKPAAARLDGSPGAKPSTSPTVIDRSLLQRYRGLGPFEKFGVWAGVASILGLLIAVATLRPAWLAWSTDDMLVQNGSIRVQANVSNPTIDVYYAIAYEAPPELTWPNMPYRFRVIEQRADGFKIEFSGPYDGVGPPQWQAKGLRKHK